MKRNTRAALIAAVVVAATGATAGSPPLSEATTPSPRSRAGHWRGRRLRPSSTPAADIETEVGDEECYYEVEVTLPSGEQTDVQLDRSFQLVGSETDAEDGSANNPAADD